MNVSFEGTCFVQNYLVLINEDALIFQLLYNVLLSKVQFAQLVLVLAHRPRSIKTVTNAEGIASRPS